MIRVRILGRFGRQPLHVSLLILLSSHASWANYQGPAAPPKLPSRNAAAAPHNVPSGSASAVTANGPSAPTPPSRSLSSARPRASDVLGVQGASSSSNPNIPSFQSAYGTPGTLPSSAGVALQSAVQPTAVAPYPYMMPTSNQDNSMPMMMALAGGALRALGGNNGRPSSRNDYPTGTSVSRSGGTNSYPTDERPEIYKNPVDGVPPMTCVSCSKPTSQDPRFQSCTNKNGYYEDALASSTDPGFAVLKNHRPENSTVTCIANGLREVNTGYRYCGSNMGGYGSQVSAPCASEQMATAIASAFELTSDCLSSYLEPSAEDNPEAKASVRRAAFQLMNHESGWAINAVSTTGAGGPGQMVQGAIEDVNKLEWPKIQQQVRSSSNPSCRTLAQMKYIPWSGSVSNACERISPKNGNPQLNMMYTFGHLKMVRSRLESTLNSSSVNLTPQVRTQLLDQLTVWGHNVGSGGIAEILRISLAKRSDLLRSGKVADFLSQMQADVHQWHTARSSRSPGEPTAFLASTQKDLAAIEKRSGGTCGVFKTEPSPPVIMSESIKQPEGGSRAPSESRTGVN